MNKFIIPQFIDVEDRIFGPITVRQFLICAVAGVAIFISYKVADFYLFLTSSVLMAGFAAVTAFVKINGKQFHFFFLDIVEYLTKVPKFAIWQRSEAIPLIKKIEEKKKDDFLEFQQKALPQKRLSEISLIVDTGGFYVGESDEKKDQNLL